MQTCEPRRSSHEKIMFQVPKGSNILKAIASPRRLGEKRRTWRGVWLRRARRGRSRNLGGPRLSCERPDQRGAGNPSSRTTRASECARVVAEPGKGSAKKSARREVGRKQGATGAEAERDEGVGGPRKSEEVGKRLAPEADGAKAARVE